MAGGARLLLDLELEEVAGDNPRDDIYNENFVTPSSGVAWGYVYVTFMPQLCCFMRVCVIEKVLNPFC